jgi:hypothetical protein
MPTTFSQNILDIQLAGKGGAVEEDVGVCYVHLNDAFDATSSKSSKPPGAGSRAN